MTDLLLQTEQPSEAELHPQMNRPPSQAEENSSAKKVRPAHVVPLWFAFVNKCGWFKF